MNFYCATIVMSKSSSDGADGQRLAVRYNGSNWPNLPLTNFDVFTSIQLKRNISLQNQEQLD